MQGKHQQVNEAMIKVAQYRELILPEIYSQFSYDYGLLVEGSDRRTNTAQVSICLGNSDNPPYPWKPKVCLVWGGERLLYEGEIDNALCICRILNRFRVCCLQFTTVRRLERSKAGGTFFCCETDPSKRCTCKRKCPLRQVPTPETCGNSRGQIRLEFASLVV